MIEQDVYLAVVAELAELRLEEELNFALITKQSDILRVVADALHGGPLQDGWWSHHDLGELAQRQHGALVEARDLIKSVYVADRSGDAHPTVLAFTMGKIWAAIDEALKDESHIPG